MYDEPLENVATMSWMASRLKHHQLLNQPNVGPLQLVNIDSFESLMFLAEQGRDLGVLFEQRQDRKWEGVRLEVYLRSVSSFEKFRLPCVSETFDKVSRRSVEMMKAEARIPTS